MLTTPLAASASFLAFAWPMQPLLAIDVGQFIGLAVLVVTVLSWVVNIIKGIQEQAAASRMRRAARPQQAASLEDFVRQMAQAAEKSKREAEPRAEEPIFEAARPEPVPPLTPRSEPVRRPPINTPAPAARGGLKPRAGGANKPASTNRNAPPVGKGLKPRRDKPAPAKPVTQSVFDEPPAPPVVERHMPAPAVATATLGSDLRAHLASYMQSGAVTQAAQQNAGSRVDDAVRRDLGAVAPQATREAPHPLVSVLRSPDGIRNAVIINEILQRPQVGSRRRR